jgi:hypothetical protein
MKMALESQEDYSSDSDSDTSPNDDKTKSNLKQSVMDRKLNLMRKRAEIGFLKR